MRAIFYILAVMLWTLTGAAQAQDLTVLARVEADKSEIRDGWFGKTQITIQLSQGVPFRVFLLDAPARLVVDFREADWSAARPSDILPQAGRITDVRFGAFRPGWSRLVADLSEPMLPKQIGMPVVDDSGVATLEITLETVDAAAFAKAAGAPADARWASKVDAPAVPPKGDDGFVVMLDPGHGGIDPGATRGGVSEKDLMLNIGRALAENLRRAGVTALLTREEDVFVALETRVALAHQAQADVFVSLHADALREGGARGATVYTLSQEASDAASAHLAARHNRSDIIAGVDLTGSDDQVASVLLDLARQETEPRSKALSEHLIAGMDGAGGPMNRRPARQAGFSVLKSADIPSVLIEVGFLSSQRDLANLKDPVWRAVMVDAMAGAILAWRDADAALKPLVRQ